MLTQGEPELFVNESLRKLIDIKISETDGCIDLDASMQLLEKQIKGELLPTLNRTYSFNLRDAVTLARSLSTISP